MADNYNFKDGNRVILSRAAKQLDSGIYANKDIEILENGSPAKTCNSATVTLVIVTDAGTTLASANPNRKGLLVQIASDGVRLHIKYGTGATTALYSIRLPPNTLWEMPSPTYLGVITAVTPLTLVCETLLTELN